MTKSATINVRIDPDLKADAETVLKQIGLSTSDLITMTYRQIVMQQGLPFVAKVPNAETRAAMEEHQREKADGELLRFENASDAMAHLLTSDERGT